MTCSNNILIYSAIGITQAFLTGRALPAGTGKPSLDKTTPNANPNTTLGSFLAWEFGFLVSVFGGGVFYGCIDLSAYEES